MNPFEKKFQVRVAHYAYGYYTVEFTNNNWFTYTEFKQYLWEDEMNPYLETNKSKAIIFAKQFKSYRQCVDYNKAEYAKRVDYKDTYIQ